MRLVVYGPNRLGCLQEDGSIVDLNLAYTALLDRRGLARPYAHACSHLPADLLGFIKEEPAIRAAEEAVSFVGGGGVEGPQGERLIFKPGEVKVRAPLPSFASRIAMAGANFYDHAAGAYSMIRGVKITVEDIKRDVEEGRPPPWGFWKCARNVVGPDEPVIYPARTEHLITR